MSEELYVCPRCGKEIFYGFKKDCKLYTCCENGKLVKKKYYERYQIRQERRLTQIEAILKVFGKLRVITLYSKIKNNNVSYRTFDRDLQRLDNLGKISRNTTNGTTYVRWAEDEAIIK